MIHTFISFHLNRPKFWVGNFMTVSITTGKSSANATDANAPVEGDGLQEGGKNKHASINQVP